MRRTRIVCTIGPACSRRTMLRCMVRAGMDVARLNFSHGTHASHLASIETLRAVSQGASRPLALLQDLCGPKIRLGDIAAGVIHLRTGQEIVLTTRPVPGDEHEVHLPVPELAAALRKGDMVYIDDGKLEARVVRTDGADVTLRAMLPGDISGKKGIAAPGVHADIAAVTEKDADDLRFGMAAGVDVVAASFVSGPEDIRRVREIMRQAGRVAPIIAKIEKREAVANLAAIIEEADGIMIARGDLGVELPIDEVPMLQKRIIRQCNRAGKPVITATQMLDSMIHNRRPTRAEVTDVANAILDGTDAVMLSGETAAGDFPLDAVRMMSTLAVEVEPDLRPRDPAEVACHGADVAESVAQAAVAMAQTLRARAILCVTMTGSTARLVAKYRPATRIIAATPSEETFRRLALTWGVMPLLTPAWESVDEALAGAVGAAERAGLVKQGDCLIATAGVPVNRTGSTNLIRVHRVGAPLQGGRRA
jgi:pyruvate kinase